ncbi:MAG TPA: HPF/RaiA family ribosome-associated protein [Gemmatimonadales bacterium]|nr:HPF/RaiA family ribosome-associated protein [Gemmatimonadales bacterium]
MRVTITARHCTLSEEVRERARELLGRIGKLVPRARAAQAIFSEAHGTASVELLLRATRGQVLVGHADGADHRSALDLAADRVRRQLDKALPRRTGAARRRAAARQGSPE